MPSYKDLGIDYTSGHLNITNVQLVSLSGCPEHISGDIRARANKLTSLVGGPQIVDWHYSCHMNKLTSLVGCASHIGGIFDYRSNDTMTSLVGIHKIIKSCKQIHFNSDKITQGGIGLLLIANLTDITYCSLPFKIISNYLSTGTKGMMECRTELISKGYANYAKL